MNLDDCWQRTRDSDGIIHPDPEAFPSGISALADYVHSKNLKFGLYSGTKVAYISLFITVFFFCFIYQMPDSKHVVDDLLH